MNKFKGSVIISVINKLNYIFSIKNEGTHKVFRFFFLKFKFKKTKNYELKREQKLILLDIERRLLKNEKKLKFTSSNIKPSVVIVIYHRAHWSLCSVCTEMIKRGFDIKILVSPAMEIEPELREQEFEVNCKFFENLGYEIIRGYDFQTGLKYDLNENLPDIIIYQSHWMLDILPEYDIKYFYNKAICLSIPYGIMIASIQNEQFNQEFHNLVYLNFAETKKQYEMSKNYAENKGVNVVVTGYPKMDELFNSNDVTNHWKVCKTDVKKIIWAPHYSINTDWDVNFANFHKYYEFFYSYVKNNKNIEMILKPHPMLKSRCMQTGVMTADEYDNYLYNWNNLENGKVVLDGNYMDLFKTSDAMILDSISFICEYMYLQKPICFLNKFKNVDELLAHFNEFGCELLPKCYISQNENEIKHFVETVVCGNQDYMKNKREAFFEKYLNINTGAVGKYIVDYISKEFDISND